MKLYFKTREQARQFASKTNKKAPTTKEALQGVNAGRWGVKL